MSMLERSGAEVPSRDPGVKMHLLVSSVHSAFALRRLGGYPQLFLWDLSPVSANRFVAGPGPGRPGGDFFVCSFVGDASLHL